jgi:dephospho-CoA kinase
LTVGLAGKACAGKDSLVPFFVERGFTVIDADRIGHQALEANAAAVRKRFGTTDRTLLGRLVFSDPRALADLEGITHPWIAGQIRDRRAAVSGDALLNVPLLHKQALYRLCDVVVWVQAPLLVRVLRARKRDGWTWERILRRIWAQRKLGPQVFPADVDILRVDNRGTLRAARTALEARFGRGTAFSKKEETHEKQ